MLEELFEPDGDFEGDHYCYNEMIQKSESVPFPRILVGIDNSEPAKKAFDWAVENARKGDSIFLCLVVAPSAVSHAKDRQEREEILEKVWVALKTEYETRAKSVSIIPLLIVSRNVRKSLVSIAQDLDVKMLVVGSRGHSMIERMFMGDTSKYVADHSNTCVVVVR